MVNVHHLEDNNSVKYKIPIPNLTFATSVGRCSIERSNFQVHFVKVWNLFYVSTKNYTGIFVSILACTSIYMQSKIIWMSKIETITASIKFK